MFYDYESCLVLKIHFGGLVGAQVGDIRAYYMQTQCHNAVYSH